VSSRRELLALSALGLLGACASPRPRARSLEPRDEESPAAPAVGDAIVVCGERHSILTPVVLWDDPGGYDASRTELCFPSEPPADPPQGLRYAPGRTREGGASVAPDGDRAALARVVDQFVLHYDACGASRRCFQVLHDRRGLSVHFLLDVDGTLYQTLDLVHTAWHARQANARSIGVEIAHPGAFAPDSDELARWYTVEGGRARLNVPTTAGATGVRTSGFVARPRRPAPVRGRVQGRELLQYDYTPEQYRALWFLCLGLSRVFPRLALSVPRDARGLVRDRVLPDVEFARFRGILGHHHVSAEKTDPGPAFDWSELPAQVDA
jgi:N-acetyl-anhydromuramyl-L-alanine amidase AmpD